MAPRSSVSAPPPNLDDPSTDEESVREPTPPPPPKSKAKSRRLPFNPECMTIIDGVVYQDRTPDRHLPLDPFIHLRAPELQQLIQLLADPNELNKRLKRPSRVLKLIEYALPTLVRLFSLFGLLTQFSNHFPGEADRGLAFRSWLAPRIGSPLLSSSLHLRCDRSRPKTTIRTFPEAPDQEEQAV